MGSASTTGTQEKALPVPPMPGPSPLEENEEVLTLHAESVLMDGSDSPVLGSFGMSREREDDGDNDSVIVDLSYLPAMHFRPRAPTPSAVAHRNSSNDDSWLQSPQSPYNPYALTDSPIAIVPPDSPALLNRPHSPIVRSASYNEDPYLFDPSSSRHLTQPTKLPDPSQFPDPYPLRPPQCFSSEGSSSASTRSSAYTNSGSVRAPSDYGHARLLSDEETPDGEDAASDEIDQLAQELYPSTSSSHEPGHGDQRRWSYLNHSRSRSSSLGNVGENATSRLEGSPSFHNSWQPDERDEMGVMTSDEDTDYELGMDENDETKEYGPTAALTAAEEGRGLIVRGEGLNVIQLQLKVQPGTTHLLLGATSTPNAMPGFLSSTLPKISSSLLCLDVSVNYLHALPRALVSCVHLEELNIASNPLRALPEFLAELTSLRVLIADATGISTVPDAFSSLDKLDTLSIRRNKMNSLPSWLCLLPSLQTLLLDGNPFQGPWKALVDPLLATSTLTPAYTPSTPMIPLPSASIQGSTDETDDSSDRDSPAPTREGHLAIFSEEEEDDNGARRTPLGRNVSSPVVMQNGDQSYSQAPGVRLSRTRTAPNRRYPGTSFSVVGPPKQSPKPVTDSGYFGDREVRKMKSAGDLRRTRPSSPVPASPIPPPLANLPSPPLPPPFERPPLPHAASSSNLLLQAAAETGDEDLAGLPRRFASLGVTSGRGANRARPSIHHSVWDSFSGDETDLPTPPPPPVTSGRASRTNSRPTSPVLTREQSKGRTSPENTRRLAPKDDKEKPGRWGFLKKMSMGKMRSDSPSSSRSAHPPERHDGKPPPVNPLLTGGFMSPVIKVSSSSHSQHSSRHNSRHTKPSQESSKVRSIPEVPMAEAPAPSPRISRAKSSASSSIPMDRKPSLAALKIASPPATATPALSPPNSLLSPGSPGGKSRKRKSFLPIDGSPIALNIPIPSASEFMAPAMATNGSEDSDQLRMSLPDPEELRRKEEERIRETYNRALRSVMAYLRDMYDLGRTQTITHSMYGALPGEVTRPGSRRPTLTDGSRVVSDGSILSNGSCGFSEQQRTLDGLSVARNGTSAHTMSVMTTDSGGSNSVGGEERKYKDDKSKRSMIIREIVETEQTYVKGLQELADIYIKPACLPVNTLGGVGTSKETVIPAAERKIVFGGLDSLISFHKESFLPALRRAAEPVMKPSAELAETDVDGRLSSDIAKSVASTFVSHAAFMKMYSTYINNFDTSVQRIKYWTTSSRANTNSPSALSPSSSTAQIAGIAMTMSAVSAPAVRPEGGSDGTAPITSSQRKRIKTYLKRCRANPRHSQLNLEGYLLLPIQRIPRYRLLLEELVKSTPPTPDSPEDTLDRALGEISSLATSMNEGKRESESRRKLVQWQARIRGKFPSPLVQPHRRLIMDGPLLLTRVVRKATVPFEVFNAQGDASIIEVECLSPECTPRPLIGILCNDLLVLCRDSSEGNDPNSLVDLWAVLRMQTLPQPCSVVHGNALRIVDNKAVLYFDVPSSSDALNWFRAINLHIPASKA